MKFRRLNLLLCASVFLIFAPFGRADAIVTCVQSTIRIVLEKQGEPSSAVAIGSGNKVLIPSSVIAQVGQNDYRLCVFGENPVDGDDGRYDGSEMVRDGNRYEFRWLDENGKPASRSMTWRGEL